VAALRQQKIFDKTVLIVTAKHGQVPMDPSKRLIVDSSIIPNLVNSVQAACWPKLRKTTLACSGSRIRAK
jgi:hypothetical protein